MRNLTSNDSVLLRFLTRRFKSIFRSMFTTQSRKLNKFLIFILKTEHNHRRVFQLNLVAAFIIGSDDTAVLKSPVNMVPHYKVILQPAKTLAKHAVGIFKLTQVYAGASASPKFFVTHSHLK